MSTNAEKWPVPPGQMSGHDLNDNPRKSGLHVSDPTHPIKTQPSAASFGKNLFHQKMEHAQEIMLRPTWIIVSAALGILASGVIGIGAIYVCTLIVLPNIIWFNALHSTVGIAGSLAVASTHRLVNHLEDCLMAISLEAGRGNKPIRLSDLAVRSTGRVSAHNRWRELLMWIRWGFVFSIWLVSLNLEYHEVSTYIGTYNCIPANYDGQPGPSLPEQLSFISGTTTFARIYQYALPLTNGAVGGWSAWPLAGPEDEFSVSSYGPVYLIGVNCSNADPISLIDGPPPASTWLNTTRLPDNGEVMRWRVNVTYPLNSVIDMEEFPVRQVCDMHVKWGYGRTETTFVQDEWDMVTGGTIVNLWTGSLHMVWKDPDHISYQTVLSKMDSVKNEDRNLIAWTPAMVTELFNSTTTPSQGGTFSNLMQWSTQPDGYYYPNCTYRGLAAVAAAGFQFLSMQYDSSRVGQCQYYAKVGGGQTMISRGWMIALVVLGSVTILLSLAQIAEWAIHHGRETASNRVLRSLSNPIRMAYDLRRVFTRQGEPEMGDASDQDFKEYLQRQKVLYGEFRATENDTVGEVGFGRPDQMIPLQPGRRYHRA